MRLKSRMRRRRKRKWRKVATIRRYKKKKQLLFP
jgi:hypothetical protein